MFSDPLHLKASDPGHTANNPLFIYLEAFSEPAHFAEFLPEYNGLDELAAHYEAGGLGDVKVKRFLTKVLQATLAPIRQRREQAAKDLPAVYEMLKQGSAKAREVAAQILERVQRAMHLDYFNH